MAFFLFGAIEVPTSAVHCLVIVASAGMNDRVRHASFGVAGTSIDRSIVCLQERTSSLKFHATTIRGLQKSCRVEALNTHLHPAIATTVIAAQLLTSATTIQGTIAVD